MRAPVLSHSYQHIHFFIITNLIHEKMGVCINLISSSLIMKLFFKIYFLKICVPFSMGLSVFTFWRGLAIGFFSYWFLYMNFLHIKKISHCV